MTKLQTSRVGCSVHNKVRRMISSILRSLVLPLVAFFIAAMTEIAASEERLQAEAPGRLPSRLLLDDERLNQRFAEAREFQLSKICLVSNTYCDCRKDIGPAGIRHTLAGMEFPWRHPGGRSVSGLTKKFVWPANVKAIKNVRLRQRGVVSKVGNRYVLANSFSRIGWKWPKDTTLFELHLHPGGWPFELRVLEKVQDKIGFSAYDVHVFRPFAAEADLPFDAAGEHVDYDINSTHPVNAFQAVGHVVEYPDFQVDWATLVRAAPWPDTTGHNWHHAGKGDGWLSPKGYRGWMTGSTRESCAKCHDNAGAPVALFEPFRDWYGHIPGADGIFSFDPIDRRTVSLRGPHGRGYRWRDN